MNMKYYLEDAEQTSFILWEKCKKYNGIFEQRIIFFWANNDSTFDRNQNMLLPWLSNDSHWLFILCIDCTRLDYSSGLRFDWAISSVFQIFYFPFLTFPFLADPFCLPPALSRSSVPLDLTNKRAVLPESDQSEASITWERSGARRRPRVRRSVWSPVP